MRVTENNIWSNKILTNQCRAVSGLGLSPNRHPTRYCEHVETGNEATVSNWIHLLGALHVHVPVVVFGWLFPVLFCSCSAVFPVFCLPPVFLCFSPQQLSPISLVSFASFHLHLIPPH